RPGGRPTGGSACTHAEEVGVDDCGEDDGGGAGVGEVVGRPGQHLAAANAVVEQAAVEEGHEWVRAGAAQAQRSSRYQASPRISWLANCAAASAPRLGIRSRHRNRAGPAMNECGAGVTVKPTRSKASWARRMW